MEHKTLQTSRGHLFYATEGNHTQPCLLFLHGAMMDYRMFVPQANYFGNDYFIIMPDLPAHGKSRPYEEFSFAHTVEDLLQILQREGVDSVHLVGHSMGGYIAQELYRYAPQVVRSLTCASSAPLGGHYYTKADERLFQLTPSILKLYSMKHLIQDIVQRDTLTPASSQYTANTLQRYTKQELIDIMSVIGRDLRFEEETEIRCPFCILVGESDNAGKVKEYSQRWASETGAHYEQIPLAAHMINVDNPGSFNIIFEKWLKSLNKFWFE